MSGKMKLLGKVLAGVLIVSQLMGCGTIFHGDRVGQKGGGNVDVGIVIADAVGVLFFVVPGVIAFVVDFSDGAIYLPRHGRRDSDNSFNMKDAVKISFNAKNCTMADIEKAVKGETGCDVNLGRTGVQVYAFDSLKDLNANYAMYLPGRNIVLSSR
jgi:hypothetical protein